jgi:glycosyltransferase involved in cell wall biosynthesis
MKQYRVPFFIGLSEALKQDRIDLKVVYSNTNRMHALRKDSADLNPPLGEKVPGRWFFQKFIYQPLWKDIFQSDLIVIGPEIKYLINPFLLILSALGLKRIAYWGLAPNPHPTRHAPTEWVKDQFVSCVDWWFAYTASAASYLRRKGMPESRITVVQNATDSQQMTRLLGEIGGDQVVVQRLQLTGNPNSKIGLFCGVIAEIKDVPMLLDAARLVKQRVPDFHLVLIGDGPDRSWLEEAIRGEPWIHYLGFKSGPQLAIQFKSADVFLLAGTAGLAIVDCFAAGLPPIVTHLPTHPPEISYIVDGVNGCITPHSAAAFADGIVEVLADPHRLELLRSGARYSGTQYTMEVMVENFRQGINRCLLLHKTGNTRDVHTGDVLTTEAIAASAGPGAAHSDK